MAEKNTRTEMAEKNHQLTITVLDLDRSKEAYLFNFSVLISRCHREMIYPEEVL
jgi:hypothetical protein